MTNSQNLTTIAAFMGWEIESWGEPVIFMTPDSEYYPVNSFYTMRMVFDEWITKTEEVKMSIRYKRIKYVNEIQFELSYCTPSDCAARLAEAIEWWKSVE